ncbi:MAG TPA: (Fe-S)-binding protein [Polyangia bacterium]|jgi:Fe-S oxidoreductase
MRPFVFGVLLLLALAVFGRTVTRFTRFLLRGRPVTHRFGEPWARFKDVLVYFFGQRSVVREQRSWHHPFIFWGFLIITVGTIELIVRGFAPGFTFAALAVPFDTPFKAVLDFTNAVVLAAVAFGFYRRLVIKPPLLPFSGEAGLILGLIAGLCVTHFLLHGFAAVATGHHADHMPISMGVAHLARGMTPAGAAVASEVSFWTHMGIILFFLNYIPYSKHIHLLGALPNIALRQRGQHGVLPRADLEDETQWGVGCYERFDWKQLLDSYACTDCARCTNSCPAWLTEKPLSPWQIILDIRHEMWERGDLLLRLPPTVAAPAPGVAADAAAPGLTEDDRDNLKLLAAAPPLVGGRTKEESLWACVACGACEAACPVFIEHPTKILQERTHLVLAESRMPAELGRMFRGLEANQNPWGLGADKRMDWAFGLDLPIMADKGRAEYLAWIGCAASYDDRAKKIARTWVQLLQRAGVDFAVLGLEETCNGDWARRTGNEFLFQTLAQANVELFAGYEVKKILVICPHCYHSFKNEYPQLGGHYEVWHHSQFLARLIAEGKLRPDRDVSRALTYHDACYLGRWNGVYDAPRALLGAAAGGRPPREMPRHGQESFCCGAGGGHLFMEDAPPRINVRRAEEAVATGADTVATACPFCMIMLTDGLKTLDQEDRVKVLDVCEVLSAALPAADAPG